MLFFPNIPPLDPFPLPVPQMLDFAWIGSVFPSSFFLHIFLVISFTTCSSNLSLPSIPKSSNLFLSQALVSTAN